MITNSKQDLCEICGGTREEPKYRDEGHASEFHSTWHDACPRVVVNPCRRCTAPFHSQADKHKRVAERLWEYRFKPGANKLEFERILREEYPE